MELAYEVALRRIYEARKKNSPILNLNAIGLTKLPSEIQGLSQLKELHLSDNRFAEFPEIVLSLRGLEYLDLAENNLVAIPSSISKLRKLQTLCLSENRLIVLPDTLAKLKRLKKLILGSNLLSELPEVVLELENLEFLCLSRNQIHTLDIPFGRLKNLKKLRLDNNKLGANVTRIFKCTSLEVLDIASNDIDAISEEIGRLKELRELYLDNNMLQSLPTALVKLIRLRCLSIDGNPFQVFPSIVCNLAWLERLHCSRTLIKEFPTSIRKMKNLERLWSSENKFYGFPVAVCDLPDLSYLGLSDCGLNSLPSEIKRLKRLSYLELSHNKLTYLPEGIGELLNLTTLNVSSNLLSEIPKNLVKLNNLKTLELANNRYTELPLWLSSLPNLTELGLHRNPLNDNSPFLDKGFVGVYQKLLANHRERIRVSVIKIADGLKGVFQQYLTDFENFLRETEQILIQFNTKQVKNGLEIEIELPANHDESTEGRIQDALNKYLSLIHPINHDKLNELLSSYLKKATQLTQEYYRNKVSQFLHNLPIAQERINEKNQVELLKDEVKELKHLVTKTIDSARKRTLEVTEPHADILQLVKAANELKQMTLLSAKLPIPFNGTSVFFKLSEILLFKIGDENNEKDRKLYCYHLNHTKRVYLDSKFIDRTEHDVLFSYRKIMVDLTLDEVLSTWPQHFVWVNRKCVVNPYFIFAISNIEKKGIIQMEHIPFPIEVFAEKRKEVWRILLEHPYLKGVIASDISH